METNHHFKLEWKIHESNKDITIKEFLKRERISLTSLKDIKYRGGAILVNEKPEIVHYRLQPGDTLTILFPPEKPSEKLIAEELPLSVAYEDPYILIVNKPPYMDTIPSRDRKSGSLANGLMGYYKKIGLNRSPHIVTRLDRNTSGLVLAAKHKHIHHLFNHFYASTVQKEYVALAEGVFQEERGTINAAIGRKPGSIIERIVTPEGKPAITHFQVLKQFSEFAYVKILTETGRTHQIRVHMAYIGHPLLGDDLYGGKTEHIKRHALHCSKISFIHPIKKIPVQVTADLEDDMKTLIEDH